VRFSHDRKHLRRCRQFIPEDISLVHLEQRELSTLHRALVWTILDYNALIAVSTYPLRLSEFAFLQHSFQATRKRNSDP
jgi:hypothetical protein